jgi:hypothetical protein
LTALNPPAACLAVLTEPSIAMPAKPTPEGTVQIYVGGQPVGVPVMLKGQNNSLTPEFTALFPHVVLDDRVQLRVMLINHRLVLRSEPFGTVELNGRDLLAAFNLGQGHVFDVPVAAQEPHQILFVGVSAIRE